jgi:hypothetical protein
LDRAIVARALVAFLLMFRRVEAGPSRTAVRSAPTILGREIPRFVLAQPIRILRGAAGVTNGDMLSRPAGQMLPGQLVPVSEDAEGVYFQAARGFQSEGMTISQPGGLYVSKTRPETMFAYRGEARELREELVVHSQRLAGGDMAKLKIGTVEPKPAR